MLRCKCLRAPPIVPYCATPKAAGVLLTQITVLRAELKGDMAALRAELMEHIGALRVERNALRTELKVELQTMKADLVRWVFVVIMGQTAMLLGVLYLFIRYLK